VDDKANALIGLIPAVGMMAVGVVAILWYRVATGAAWKWFWIGAALWTVAVAIKVAIALVSNAAVIGFLKSQLSHPAYVVAGASYVGIQSSLCEMGITWLAVLIWRQLGKDAERAIAVGVGAGALEAFLLGATVLIGIIVMLANLPGAETVRAQLINSDKSTPLVWLVAPVERIIAILVHASTRALVLLGTAHRKPLMVVCGLLIFTFIDGVAGAAHLSGALATISVWWIELALLPFAIISVFVLKWCFSRWGPTTDAGEAATNM
jgi:uncharacterized membrane protein YhfC